MNRKHIVVVEDEDDILELLRFHLTREGYEVSAVRNGEEAVAAIPRKMPDLVLLDLMLPGLNGLDVSRQLKKDDRTAAIPIIMVTAKGEESDIITGLELGADDYITKPFSMKILLARVRAVLRRKQEPVADRITPICIHGLEIHPGRHEVRVGGTLVDMTFSEFGILHALASRPGWVLTREQIVDAVRGHGYAVTDRAVDVQIVGIRRKLGTKADCIETVRGVGYRFKEKE